MRHARIIPIPQPVRFRIPRTAAGRLDWAEIAFWASPVFVIGYLALVLSA